MALADPWRMEVLRAARELSLPDWAIGAGFVRSMVWDAAHRYVEPTPLPDIDLLFHDPLDRSSEREVRLEEALARLMPGLPWEARNQARMHLKNNGTTGRPYRDTKEALGHWLETATAVALRLEDDDSLTVIAPFSLHDLFALKSGPTPAGRHQAESYRKRMTAKNWPGIWPKVVVEML
jgi:hypothetical protein